MIRRILRFLVGLVILLVLLALASFATFRYLESRRYFEEKIRAELALYVDGVIGVESADVELLDRTISSTNLTLRESAGAEPRVVIPELEVRLPLGGSEDGRWRPDRILVRAPRIELEERPDGTVSPLDLLRPAMPTFVPVVSIEDGIVRFFGEGPVRRFLDTYLRPSAFRVIDQVQFASFPEPAPSTALFGFRGSFRLPGLGVAGLRGSFGRAGDLRLIVTARNLDLAGVELRKELHAVWEDVLARHVTRGMAALELTLESEDAFAPSPTGLRVEARLQDLALRHEFLAGGIDELAGRASFNGRDVRVDLAMPEEDGIVRVEGAAEDVLGDGRWVLTLRADRLRAKGPLVSSLTHATLRRAIGDYAVEGPVELLVEVSGQADSEPQVEWRVRSLGASASFVGHVDEDDPNDRIGFPYRLRDVEGEVAGRDRRIQIRRIRGRHNGGEVATVEGDVLLTGDGNADFTVDVRADDVPIDATLIGALESASPGVTARIERWAPEGSVDFDVRVAKGAADEHSRAAGWVRAKDLTLAPRELPSTLTVNEAYVTFEQRVYRVESFTATCKRTRIDASGRLDLTDAREGFRFRASIKNLDVGDEELWAALRSALDHYGHGLPALLEPLQPSQPFGIEGVVDVDLELFQEPGERARFRAVVYPRGVKLLPSWLPLPVEGVLGRIVLGNMDGDGDELVVDVEELSGRAAGGTLHVRGAWRGGRPARLLVEGIRLRLTDRLLTEAMRIVGRIESGGTLSFGDVLSGLTANGVVSFRYEHDPALARGDKLDLDLFGLDCDGGMFSAAGVRALEGRVHVDFGARRVEASNLVGTMLAGASRAASDRIVLEFGRESMTLTGDLDLATLPFDERIVPFLLPRLRELARSVAGGGRLHARLDSLRVRFRRAGAALEPDEVVFQGSARFDGCVLRLPIPVSELDVDLDLWGRAQLVGDGGYEVLGRFRELAFASGDVRLSHLNADLLADDRSVRVRAIRGGFAGGVLVPGENFITFEPDAPVQVRGNVRLDEADLATLSAAMGAGSGEIAGRASLDWRFSGSIANLGSIEGPGRIDLRDGQLWEIPVFAALYRFSLGLLFGESGKPTFETGLIEFHVAAGQMIIDTFELDAPVTMAPVGLTVRGSGVVGPTGVDLRVVPQVISIDLPLISPVIELLKKGLLNYRIFGPFGNPRVAYWNVATAVMYDDDDVTRLPRLAPRRAYDWRRRF